MDYKGERQQLQCQNTLKSLRRHFIWQLRKQLSLTVLPSNLQLPPVDSRSDQKKECKAVFSLNKLFPWSILRKSILKLLPFSNLQQILFMWSHQQSPTTVLHYFSRIFKELHSNLFYVTTELSFCYQIHDKQLFTRLVFSPTSLHRRKLSVRVWLEGKLAALWWRAAKLRRRRLWKPKSASCLTSKCQELHNCSDTSYCSPARTSGSLSNVGGSADFVVFLWQKNTDLSFVEVLLTFVLKIKAAHCRWKVRICLLSHEGPVESESPRKRLKISERHQITSLVSFLQDISQPY